MGSWPSIGGRTRWRERPASGEGAAAAGKLFDPNPGDSQDAVRLDEAGLPARGSLSNRAPGPLRGVEKERNGSFFGNPP
ncbi:MAG: hypothetical protein CL933_21040 [Deltaproteobacteria bacterium]|nr:hypothetical protein [Deltaproteobacteria bacterium]